MTEIAVNQNIDKIIFVGKEMAYGYFIAKEIKNTKNLLVELKSLESYDDKSIFELTEELEKSAKSGDLFFLKGSRGIKLERIADKLAAKVVKNEI